jgi:hypothetical protein
MLTVIVTIIDNSNQTSVMIIVMHRARLIKRELLRIDDYLHDYLHRGAGFDDFSHYDNCDNRRHGAGAFNGIRLSPEPRNAC